MRACWPRSARWSTARCWPGWKRRPRRCRTTTRVDSLRTAQSSAVARLADELPQPDQHGAPVRNIAVMPPRSDTRPATTAPSARPGRPRRRPARPAWSARRPAPRSARLRRADGCARSATGRDGRRPASDRSSTAPQRMIHSVVLIRPCSPLRPAVCGQPRRHDRGKENPCGRPDRHMPGRADGL